MYKVNLYGRFLTLQVKKGGMPITSNVLAEEIGITKNPYISMFHNKFQYILDQLRVIGQAYVDSVTL